ncbi:hypothetical protein [Escherichia sp. 20412-1]|uniref:hypothetical protein n=1 Tax=Escherichia sp. 20412-1 TaxID=2137853 RepID=UPI000D16FFDA|nr:hypothetical protein [Escherichia sp. 20412-1]PSY61259.1 hypothetical protein C7B16_21375 [Escherichia sp. 20412-1]
MNAETIKQFLVGLGFQIDETGMRKFEATLASATLKVVKLGVSVETTAVSVVAFTAKIAAGLDNLYWSSQRTGATVQGIKQIGYAVSQAGGNADAARGSLENLARFIRNNPGAEGFLNRLGIQTRDASGNMRDMAAVFTGVGQKLSSMPYYRANQYAQMLGIDENTLMAMRRGVGQFSAEYSAMTKAIGFNADQAARSSNRFMTSLQAFGEMAGMARDKIGSNLADGLAGSLDNLRQRILENFPRIENTVTKVVKGILWLGDIVAQVVFRITDGIDDLISWWGSLDRETKNLIEVIGGLVVAMRLLNSTFWMSPVGLVTALAAAIFLLWDDFKTWKEGGQHLIDWEKWQPQVDIALDMIRNLKDAVADLMKALAKLLNVDPTSWSMKWDFSNFIDQMGGFVRMLHSLADLLNAINEGRWSDAAGIGKRLLSQDSENPSAIPMVTDSANSAADWIKAHWGFDPRSVGRTVRGWFGDDEPEQHAQSVRRTLADRNNNPGNIRPGSGKGFRSFSDALEGWTAMKNQLMRYFTGKTTGRALQTVQDIVSTWAPAGDNNDPKKYAQDVAKWMGVSPNAILNLTDPRTMGALMQSMARKEGYSDWDSPLAYQAAGAASLNQQTVINVHGVSSPGEAANLIAEKQTSVNARAVQQLRGPS